MAFSTWRAVGALVALGCGVAIGVATSANGEQAKGVPAGAPPRHDVVLGPEGYLLARILAEGPLAPLAHGHVLVATRIRGEARYDPADLARSLVAIEFDAADLEADRPDWRARAGITGRLPGWQRDAVRRDMLGPDQLDAAHYPVIRFFSTGVRPVDGGVEIAGTLELRGRQRPVTVPAALTGLPGGGLQASGSFEIRPSDFDIGPYAAFAGLLRNQDLAEIRFDLRALRPGR